MTSPATGKSVASVPDNGASEARAAAAKAVTAFDTWRRTTAYERCAILRAWASAIMAEEAVLGRLMAQEMGKPVTEARGEVKYAVSFVEWSAEEAKRVYGTTVPSQMAHKRLIVQPKPVGPVYAITVVGSDVYVGGAFTQIGGQSRRHLAALSAATGQATAWNPNSNATARALATGGAGLYAAGDFTSIGTRSRSCVAELSAATGVATAWDPSAWEPVLALAVVSGTVYAGGYFPFIGGQPRGRIVAE